jgi:hypothetical protein
MNKIHNYLQRVKIRALIILPTLIVCLIGLFFAIIEVWSNFKFVAPTCYRITFVISSILLLTGMFILLWSDHKINNKFTKNEY